MPSELIAQLHRLHSSRVDPHLDIRVAVTAGTTLTIYAESYALNSQL